MKGQAVRRWQLSAPDEFLGALRAGDGNSGLISRVCRAGLAGKDSKDVGRGRSVFLMGTGASQLHYRSLHLGEVS